MGKHYDKNVFVNCPFDNEYRNLLNAITFAIYDCGFIACCSLQESDSGKNRFDKIKRIIKESRFGIHDISRIEVDEATQFPRFNMPLELGVFIGATTFGNAHQQKKKTLILDTEDYRYQKFMSDIAGQDIRPHENDVATAIKHIRDWLNETTRTQLPGDKIINKNYTEFRDALHDMCNEEGFDDDKLTYNDYCFFITNWIKEKEKGRL